MVFSTRHILLAIHKNVLSTFEQSDVVYEYCATMIVSMLVEGPNICRTESTSMCQSLFGTELVKNENNQNAQVNQLILYHIVTWQLRIIFYTTRNVHLTIRTINFLFFLKHNQNSTYQS